MKPVVSLRLALNMCRLFGVMVTVNVTQHLNVEHGNSVVECRTRNRASRGFEFPFATISKIEHFRSLHWRPSWLSCINEYLATDSGGNVSDLVVARNCCMARMLPGEAEFVSEWTGLPGRAKRVQRFDKFERSDRLDTALYKTTTFSPNPWYNIR